MAELKVSFDKAVAEFLERYPTILSEAPERLQGMYKAEDFPSIERVTELFHWNISFLPVPLGEFKVSLGAEQMKELKNEAIQDAKNNLANSVQVLWQRLLKPIEDLAEKLGDSKATFHRTRISSITEVVQALSALNLTDDANLEKMRRLAEDKLTDLDPQFLRDNPKERKKLGKPQKKSPTQ